LSLGIRQYCWRFLEWTLGYSQRADPCDQMWASAAPAVRTSCCIPIFRSQFYRQNLGISLEHVEQIPGSWFFDLRAKFPQLLRWRRRRATVSRSIAHHEHLFGHYMFITWNNKIQIKSRGNNQKVEFKWYCCCKIVW